MKGLSRSREEMKFARQLSDWIHSLRVNLDCTPVQLGEVAGVIPVTIQRWERGESMPNPFQLFLLRSFARQRGQELPEL